MANPNFSKMSTQLHYKLILQMQISTKGVNLRIAKKNYANMRKIDFWQKVIKQAITFSKKISYWQICIFFAMRKGSVE